ncbi:hypothetical protein BDQ17DRAFT_1350092 [Cyathus striatus]|nr:hypothetical protein BDQ17DRAFT_1350092 [Cyathus striatus]
MPKTVKFDEVFEHSEFENIFNGKGVVTQPTPTNKPKSTVTIIEFDKEKALEFFGDEFKGLTGNIWSRGGRASFLRSQMLGTTEVKINKLLVTYSQNSMKCSLKFEVYQTSGFGWGVGFGWMYKNIDEVW